MITKELRALAVKDTLPIWTDLDALVVDAIYGSVSETGWRGTITEYFANKPYMFKTMVTNAIHRLHFIDDIVARWNTSELGLFYGLQIGLGTYGWKYDTDIINKAIELGINFIDTAETYGYGRVEAALGKIEELKNVFVATKVSRNHMSSPAIVSAIGRSLCRLSLDKIELYQVHRPNPKYPVRDVMKTMVVLLGLNKIGAIGVCNFSVDQLILAQSYLEGTRYDIEVVQVRYNLLDRRIERALLPFCKARKIAVIAYSPLGQNFKTLQLADRDGVMEYLAKRTGITEAQVALAWILSKGINVIPRTNNINHVCEIADVNQILLGDDVIELLDDAFPIRE